MLLASERSNLTNMPSAYEISMQLPIGYRTIDMLLCIIRFWSRDLYVATTAFVVVGTRVNIHDSSYGNTISSIKPADRGHYWKQLSHLSMLTYGSQRPPAALPWHRSIIVIQYRMTKDARPCNTCYITLMMITRNNHKFAYSSVGVWHVVIR